MLRFYFVLIEFFIAQLMCVCGFFFFCFISFSSQFFFLLLTLQNSLAASLIKKRSWTADGGASQSKAIISAQKAQAKAKHEDSPTKCMLENR
jgi:hypothetical protein